MTREKIYKLASILAAFIFSFILFVVLYSSFSSNTQSIFFIESLDNKIFLLNVVYFLITLALIFIIFNIQRKNQTTQIHLKRKLYLDKLTNLRNSNALSKDIKNEEFISLILVDIDSFNDINELYGFSSGNLVLQETARILKEFALTHDSSLYRIHGNEFAIVEFKMIDFPQFVSRTEELSRLFKNRTIYVEKLDMEIFIDITLGVSMLQDEPLRTAGIALKKAKKSNLRFFAYTNTLDAKGIIKKSIFWRDRIKKTIDEDNVIPFYQPIFDRNKEIIKYETLMRLKNKSNDGKVDYILPYEFLDVAIKTKQYLLLSSQVITKALSDLDRTDKDISINLSFKDVLDSHFIEQLDEILRNITKENKSRIIFELLESDLITDYTVLEDFILKYREIGIKIAIDDFGTGYSNFAHILETRPDYIKIDGSLIKDINNDKNSYEIVKSITDFSKALNIKTIAEFVHSEEVYNIVNDLGIDEFQGFYLGKPTPNIE
ncbi:EAL domain-containing protein [Poseidonibacter lekithochrous]|uniref:EAL domain-containing protein n=1 Tax=Poseidonibacter lekithochrous TaxID=1904463 RepID=UPI000D39B8F9|nr:EAL domain-containing protein [Poseidonibacter lekithochrous]